MEQSTRLLEVEQRRIIFVGERPSSPVSRAEALTGRCGKRLADLLGLSLQTYIVVCDRVNLCGGMRWSPLEARASVVALKARGGRIVLLGRRVGAEFGISAGFLTTHCGGSALLLLLPHPSGRCRWWNAPSNVAAAKLALHRFVA